MEISDFTINVFIWSVVILVCIAIQYGFSSAKDKKDLREVFTLKGIKEFFGGLGALFRVFCGLAIILFLIIMLLWCLKYIWHILPV